MTLTWTSEESAAHQDLVKKLRMLMVDCNVEMNGPDASHQQEDGVEYGLVIIGFTMIPTGILNAAVSNGVSVEIIAPAVEAWISHVKKHAGMGANDNVH